MVILTSIFVAEIEDRRGVAEPREDEHLLASDKSAFEGMRELISMYEGKNRAEPIE